MNSTRVPGRSTKTLLLTALTLTLLAGAAPAASAGESAMVTPPSCGGGTGGAVAWDQGIVQATDCAVVTFHMSSSGVHVGLSILGSHEDLFL